MPPKTIDPSRFADKSFSRKPTWANSVNDYSILIDGLTAGRIIQTMFASNVPQWSWSITGPYVPPELQPSNGHAGTLEEAQRAFKTKFSQWHRWAAQRGRGDWYGADALR